MSNNEEMKLVPRLRFPGFVESWQPKKLGGIAPLQRGFDLPSDQIVHGDIPIVYSNGSRNFHNKGMALGPGIVTGRSGTIGEIHFIEEGKYWPHNTSLWVTNFNNNHPKFVFFLFKSIGLIRFASGSGVPTLNRNDVHAYDSSVPPSLNEQQKIADCLSSLDELVAAECAKLEALKAHKKGLMQQLFPTEGETVPQLRFAGFEGEWEEATLGDHIELLSGYAFQSSFFSETGKPLVTPKNFTKNGNGSFTKENTKFTTEKTDEKYVCVAGDLLLLLTDLTPSCELLGKPLLLSNNDGEVLLNQRIVRVTPKDTIAKKFLQQFFLTESYHTTIKATATGSTVRHSSNKVILGIKLSLPCTQEQQKIADCLSSLDALITAQSEKIETLKLHKKALMQQLFP